MINISNIFAFCLSLLPYPIPFLPSKSLTIPGAPSADANATSLAARAAPAQRRLAAATLGSSANATWHELYFRLPASSPPQQFTALSGTLYAPSSTDARHKDGTYYIWPGLQPADKAGVLQNVLDGRNLQQWEMASGWCCHDPELPWGRAVYPTPGQGVRFANRLEGGNWATRVGPEAGERLGGDEATERFEVGTTTPRPRHVRG